jgi:hypothetical protein
MEAEAMRDIHFGVSTEHFSQDHVVKKRVVLTIT